MSIRSELKEAREIFIALSLYQRFEHFVILVLTALIAVVVTVAVWKLLLKVLFGLVWAGGVDPANYAIFQSVFGMIFVVIIALEFKKSLLVVAARGESVVQIRSVVLISLLAICRKIIILDLADAGAGQLLALAIAVLALGCVYWLVRDEAPGPEETLVQMDT